MAQEHDKGSLKTIMKGKIFHIKRFAVHDGPGIRTTIFFKGCPLNCWWCHNPESLDMESQQVRKIIKIGDKEFNDTEIIGKDYGLDEIMDEIEKDLVFFNESGGGVTFSGGEPMFQFDFLLALSKKCQQKAIHITLDTCGYAKLSNLKKILPYVDLILFDLKLMDDNLHKKYTGMSNKIILSNLKMLADNDKKIIVRYPLIPGVNNDKNNLEAIAAIMKTNNVNEINILPYHNIAESKYKNLRKEYKLRDLKEPDEAEIEAATRFFRDCDFLVKVGG